MDHGTVIGAPSTGTGTDSGTTAAAGLDRAGTQLGRFEALLRRQHEQFRTRQRSLGGRTPTGSSFGVATPEHAGASR